MNFEPENYSKYTLRRLAALLDVICWVLIAVVTVGICMFIEWWTACNVTKPTSKGKFDGAVDYLCSDEARFLVMRGDYSEADIIQASVSQDVIDAE